MTGGQIWPLRCHYIQSYSLINGVWCAVNPKAIKKSWPNSTCVGSPCVGYLAAKSLNYAKRMRPSWKLKRLQQPSTDICIWWKFNPILSGQSTFHLLQFHSCCQKRHPKKGKKKKKALPRMFFTSTSDSAPKQQGRWAQMWCHWPVKPPRSERNPSAFHGEPDRTWSCTASLCSHTCRMAKENIPLSNWKLEY